MANKLQNDYGSRLQICQKGPAHRWNWTSEHRPMDIMFKLNEEFEYYDATMKCNVKMVVTQCGNEFHSVRKLPKFTMKTKAVFGCEFMVLTREVVGICCTAKYIFQRCC